MPSDCFHFLVGRWYENTNSSQNQMFQCEARSKSLKALYLDFVSSKDERGDVPSFEDEDESLTEHDSDVQFTRSG